MNDDIRYMTFNVWSNRDNCNSKPIKDERSIEEKEEDASSSFEDMFNEMLFDSSNKPNHERLSHTQGNVALMTILAFLTMFYKDLIRGKNIDAEINLKKLFSMAFAAKDLEYNLEHNVIGIPGTNETLRSMTISRDEGWLLGYLGDSLCIIPASAFIKHESDGSLFDYWVIAHRGNENKTLNGSKMYEIESLINFLVSYIKENFCWRPFTESELNNVLIPIYNRYIPYVPDDEMIDSNFWRSSSYISFLGKMTNNEVQMMKHYLEVERNIRSDYSPNPQKMILVLP